MHILIELLHLVAAAALSLIGFGYERSEECNPVQFQPAAIVESAERSTDADAARPLPVSDCEAPKRTTRLPAL